MMRQKVVLSPTDLSNLAICHGKLSDRIPTKSQILEPSLYWTIIFKYYLEDNKGPAKI